MLVQLLIALLVIGALLYILQLIPLDSRIKTIIYVVVFVAIAIWLLRHLAVLGI